MNRKVNQILAIALAAGIMGMAFTCEVVEDEDVILQWSWTIEGHSASEVDYDWLCDWAGYGPSTVRLIVDVDSDTEYDYYYDATCEWLTAQTDPAQDPAGYEPGQTVWFAFQFLASDDAVVAQSANYVEITLVEGVNDLGTVDFDWEGFGPLDVLVQWGDKEVGPAFGECDLPPDPVTIMGYLLRYSDGSIADEVDIDTDPMDCTTDLAWLETEFDTYELVLDGESAGTDYWGSTCVDLVVDDETANAYECDVFMNPT